MNRHIWTPRIRTIPMLHIHVVVIRSVCHLNNTDKVLDAIHTAQYDIVPCRAHDVQHAAILNLDACPFAKLDNSICRQS